MTITIPARLGFNVTCRDTNPGDTVWVVGSVPELGAWEVKDGLELETTADIFPLWKSPLIPVHPAKILYKTGLGDLWGRIVIVAADGTPRWEQTSDKEVS
eukprot:Skav229325  [mRNA]  locus=scaffold2688:66750:68126:- [translate_table: standard]